MAEKKLVIKINQERLSAEPLEAEMITEWNIPRIILVSILMLLLVLSLIYVFSEDVKTNQPIKPKENKAETGRMIMAVVTKPVKQNLPPVNTDQDADISPDRNKRPVESDIAVEKDYQSSNAVNNRVTIQIRDKRISRAVIARSLSEKEPVDIISGAVKVVKDKATAVYFFTEINGMKGQRLYHQWLYKNKTLFKRKINILGNHWRASTSKLIVYSQKGEWRVMLVNKSGRSLAEVKFIVN